MLIDSSHRRWIVVTGLAVAASGVLFWWLNNQSPQPLTGGTTAGLWFGLVTALLMFFAGLLSAHRRLARWPFLPRRSWLLKGHIWLGLLSLWFLLLHSGFSFQWGWTIECLLWIIVVLVVGSGILGLVLQNVLPDSSRSELRRRRPMNRCRTFASRCPVRPPRSPKECAASQGMGTTAPRLGANCVLTSTRRLCPFSPAKPTRLRRSKARPVRDERFAQFIALPELAPERDRLIELQQLCDRRRQIDVQESLHHWLHVWLLAHIPLSVALLILGVVHIVMSLWY